MKHATTWIRIAHCRDIPLREGRAVKVGNREIAIFNLGDRFLAVQNRCPHKAGPLADGIVSGSTVVCPLHAWKFSLENGQGANAPSATSCVEAFPTRVEDGIVLVELGAHSHQRSEAGSADEIPSVCITPSRMVAASESPA